MPVLTLSSDTGQSDFIIGAVKGQLLTANPSLNIVDITHQLSRHNYLQAAYICRNAFKYYPAGTFHFILLNLFETGARHLLITGYNDHILICPDNGILTMICGRTPAGITAIEVHADENNSYGVLQYTKAAAKALQQLLENKTLTELGEIITAIEEKYTLRSAAGPNWIDSQIIFIDNFENVIINLTYDEFEHYRKGRAFKINFTHNETIETISRNYATVSPGEKLAWFNSAGYLEIAINKGNLAGLFGLQGYSETSMQNKLLYQTVRIYFV